MRIALFLLSALAVVTAAPTSAPSSTQAGRAVPVDESLLSQAVSLTQQTYCFVQPIGQKVGDAELLYEYGDGNIKQRAAIFHSKSLGIAVSFEGTEILSILSILHDVDFWPVDPTNALKDAVPSGTKLFKVFHSAYQDVAKPVFKNLERILSERNETRVTVIGYSLGAAMATMAAMEYQHRLEHGVHQVFAFGLPRTGNPIFANAVDEKLGGKFFYAVNGKDWVPHMPPREWNYQHPSGQIWINPSASGNYTYYPGQENVHGANSIEPVLTLQDHINYYFHTGLGPGVGQCPAKVNDQK